MECRQFFREEAHTICDDLPGAARAKYPGLELEVVGTDINSTVLETARKGVYRDYSVRNMPTLYLNKYFTDGGRPVLRCKDEVRQHVRFEFLNL